MTLHRFAATLAALNGALAVTFGTAGAHLVTAPIPRGWLVTASTFQIAHAAAAIAVLALAPDRIGRLCAALLSFGALVFAMTLALMAFGFPRWLGAVTPIGGTAMLIGWVFLAARFATERSRP